MAGNQEQDVAPEPVLSEAKRRLLLQRMRGTAPRRVLDPVHPRPAGAPVPLSAEQRRVWLHASQQPELPIYNEPFTIHRQGRFDLAILEASLNEILRRHEAWRTSFSPAGEQVIHSEVRVSLPLLDLSAFAPVEREAEGLRLATEDAMKPIPLDTIPLFRGFVVRMKDDEHRLYLTVHHIIFDGLSISRVLIPELSAIYSSLEQGKPSPLPDLTIHYGDYAIWRERQVNSAVKRNLKYWRKHLSGSLPILHLPEDRPRPSTTSHRGSMECFQIPGGLLEDLRQLGRVHGATLYMVLLAAFKVLLFRYSRQSDLIVGSATDARIRPEFEGLLGYFLHTFAIRTQPVADMRFSEYLAQTRESALGGIAAADVPFDRVVQEINPKRDANQHPIFQSFFSIRPPMPLFAPGWSLSQMDVTVATSKFDLYLELCERPDQMEGRLQYNTDIWDAATIRRMAAHWLVLLQSVCQNSESRLGALAILTPEEVSVLLGPGGWNDTAQAIPQATLNTLFENQVRRAPHAEAAVFAGENWTYGELNFRANSLASSLRTVGVTRGSIVAIALERSLDLLAGLLAILKTGAAYLPIDIQMPREGIARCLTDAQPSAILTQHSLAQLSAMSTSAIVLVDETHVNHGITAVDVRTTEATPIANELDDTAYVIYTSGTTGEPKAVEVSKRSFVNFLAAMQTAPGYAPGDVILAVTPISFDIAALEMFLPLVSGGTVVIASRDEAQDPYLLATAIQRSRCTVMQATPATWRTLLRSGWESARRVPPANSSKPLRILCGGETLPRELADSLLATGAEVWNMYGPTETTIWSLIHRVEKGTDGQVGPLSVGRPIANTTAFILDEHQQPLPVGVPGELFLGGVGLAKGYRGRRQQTSERFIRVESVGGPRLYRTGDIAVRRADGTVEVLGRTDNQVKVRGYRIELEAVEAAVSRHPDVAAAVARTWPEPAGDSRLSVYVVPRDGTLAPSPTALRAFLGSTLPDAMIPSEVTSLPAIPLTPHGKVDRSRLPRPETTVFLRPQTTLRSSDEVRLAAIWSDTLGCKQVGPNDNFFDLGGHSLLVAALQQRIVEEFGQIVPIGELFHRPTVRQQAELTRRPANVQPTLPPGVLALQPHGTRSSIFWVHYLNGQLANALGNDQPFFVVSLTAEDIASFGELPTLQSIAACQARKILATQSQGPYIIGGQCAGGVLAYEIASQLKAAGKDTALLVLLDAPNPSSLESCGSLTNKFRYLRYLLRRTAQLGLPLSLGYLSELLHNRFAHALKTKSGKTEMRVAQETIEAAARVYETGMYEGRVLLVLASDHPPHRNLLPGWRAVVPGNLQLQYVNAHHRDLLDAQNVRRVADAITHHINVGRDSAGCLTLTDQNAPAQTAYRPDMPIDQDGPQ